MIETAFGIVFLIVGATIVARLLASQRRLQEKTVSAPDRSVFSAMDLAPSAPHRFHARTSKSADTFRSFGSDLEPRKPTPALAPTGIRMDREDEGNSPGLLEDLKPPRVMPRLPSGEDEPDDPKQENLGF
jgi:hypothetical protein